jgi:hypothetical protein
MLTLLAIFVLSILLDVGWKASAAGRAARVRPAH